MHSELGKSVTRLLSHSTKKHKLVGTCLIDEYPCLSRLWVPSPIRNRLALEPVVLSLLVSLSFRHISLDQLEGLKVFLCYFQRYRLRNWEI